MGGRAGGGGAEEEEETVTLKGELRIDESIPLEGDGFNSQGVGALYSPGEQGLRSGFTSPPK